VDEGSGDVASEHDDHADGALALIAEGGDGVRARGRSAAPIASVSSKTVRSRVSATSRRRRAVTARPTGEA